MFTRRFAPVEGSVNHSACARPASVVQAATGW
jgi:hypothetical protein